MFQWTKDMIRYREDAAEYNHMEEYLADMLENYIPEGAHVCDAGCGLGYLSLALARKGFMMTAVDTDAAALEVLRRNVYREQLTNITIRQEDIFTSDNDSRFDVVISCFFGSAEENLRVIQKHCSGRGLIIKKNWNTHRFTTKPKALKLQPFIRTCEDLEDMHVPFTTKMFMLETGQPFRSIEDAVHFYKMYNKEIDMTASDIKAQLEPGLTEEFPFYQPCKREVGLIMVEAEALASDHIQFTL